MGCVANTYCIMAYSCVLRKQEKKAELVKTGGEQPPAKKFILNRHMKAQNAAGPGSSSDLSGSSMSTLYVQGNIPIVLITVKKYGVSHA